MRLHDLSEVRVYAGEGHVLLKVVLEAELIVYDHNIHSLLTAQKFSL